MNGTWNEEDVGGHPCHVYEPPERNRRNYVVMYLHGVHLGRLEDLPAFCAALDRHGLPAVCPVTQRSWWANKICPEFDSNITAEGHVLDNVMPFIKEKYGSEPPQIALLGTSMGGQGALRFAFKHPETFPIVAAISPAIDFHTRWDEGDEVLPTMFRDKEDARQETAILYAGPFNRIRNAFFCCDPTDERWFDGADRLSMKLGSMGVPYEYDLETSAGGHGPEYYSAMADKAVDFLVSALDRERLRIV